MDPTRPNRRDALRLGVAAAVAGAMPQGLLAAAPTLTAPVETTGGKVRG